MTAAAQPGQDVDVDVDYQPHLDAAHTDVGADTLVYSSSTAHTLLKYVRVAVKLLAVVS